jgi:predicted nucleic acid-binding protein
MLVVSDAGPLHYLTLVGHVDKLPVLYGAVAIPESVASELSHQHTPAPVRRFMAAPPPWLTVHAVSHFDPELGNLGRGEREAIMLAGQIQADALLCDDLLARRVASQRHLEVVGTLGVLRDAAKQRLLDIRTALDQLRTKTNFRATEDLYTAVLDEVLREPAK